MPLILSRALGCFVAVVLAMTTATASPPQVTVNAAGAAQGDRDADLLAADQLLKDSRLDDALAAYGSIRDAASLRGETRREAWSLIGCGNVHLQKALYPQARDYALRGLELAERAEDADLVGRGNLILGAAAGYMGDGAEAKVRADRSLAAFEKAGNRIGRAQATLAILGIASKITAETEQLSERAAADARSAGDAGLEAAVYHQRGDVYFAAGNYAAALAALEQAAALYSGSHDEVNLGAVYNSVGRVYRAHGQLKTALEYQLKALALHERSTQSFLTMQSLNAVSAVYQMLDEPAQARTYIERALAVAEQTGSPRIQDFLRANLANILSSLGEYGRAVELFQGVIDRNLDSYSTARHSQLAIALLKAGRLDEALRAADSAVTRCLEHEAEADVDCPFALQARADVQLVRGDADSARRDIAAVLERIENARAKLVPSDFFKREFVRSRESAYSLAITVLLKQGRAQEALETAELARSRAFIDLLASRDIKVKAPEYPALPLRGNTAAAEPQDLSSLRTAPPARTADLAAIAKRLKSTLVTYWTTRDAVFIWVVAPDGQVRSARVEVLASKLTALVRATVPLETAPTKAATLVATRGGEAFALDTPRADAWRELYDLLIRPVRSALPAVAGSMLTIVPHGSLAGLTFAALRDERGRYLLEDFTLHYAPAGAVLQFTAGERRRDGRTGSVLIVADPLVPKQAQLGRPFPSLPGAREEARAIARLVPAGRRTTLIGPDATEVRVAAAVERTAIVHFATHAVVRDNAPFESFLALGADAAGDGLMTADEVYRLNLHADLVVLSACRSGGARVSGDGIAAFARAFIYAGTPTVVASVWDVPDIVTATLVANFYRGWFSGTAKARALRSAQLQVLRELRLGRITQTTAAGPVVLPEHPIFWAGLALIGEPE